MRYTLPYPPSANRYWRTTHNGRMYKSADAKAYAWQVLACAEERTPTDKPVVVAADFYRPRKTGDLDNRLKVLLDALEGIAYENDSQIVEIHARLFDDKHEPRVEVKIYPLEDA